MKILGLCDCPTLPSGFACVARNILGHWSQMEGVQVDVWGIGFQGWGYDKFPKIQLFPAGVGAEFSTPERLSLFLKQLSIGGYTHVWVMQDTFQLTRPCATGYFPAEFQKVCHAKGIRSMMYFPVDAPLEKEWTDILGAVDVPVAYTKYGAIEAELKGGLRELEFTCQVLPHGVDQKVFHPMPAAERMKIRQDKWAQQWIGEEDFLLINVNVNQQRKDATRSLEILAELRRRGVPAKLLMHMSNIATDGHTNLEKVGRQLGLRLMKEWAHHGQYFKGGWRGSVPEEVLRELYCAADLYLSTSLGEGWGLGITEALACGTAVAIPMHTACAEIVEGLVSRQMPGQVVGLPLEKHGLVSFADNSRMRRRVDVDRAADVIEAYYKSGKWRERPAMNAGVSEWLSWERIAREMLKLLQGRTGVQTSAKGKPKYDYYLEFGGGLGDVFNQMFHRGAYNVLRDLKPDERAKVVLITHNPHVKELFENHPKRAQFDVFDLGYWHGEVADAEGRDKHNLPPPGANGKLPVRDGQMTFHPPQADFDLLQKEVGRYVQDANSRVIVFAVTAGEMSRSIPELLVKMAVHQLTKAGYVCVFVGRNYERHGRKEWEPSAECGVRSAESAINLVDKLTVPGVALLLSNAVGLVTCHSAVNILGWHMRIPQLLLYPQEVYNRHISKKDQWAFGVDFPETVHACTEGQLTVLPEGGFPFQLLVAKFENQVRKNQGLDYNSWCPSCRMDCIALQGLTRCCGVSEAKGGSHAK